MFDLIAEPLIGVKHVSLPAFGDARGRFVKLFHAPAVAATFGDVDLREAFLSTSQAGVVRGMHFQTPPHDHVKLVTCTHGRALDVVLDIRIGSPQYGQAVGIELSGARPEMVMIPSGFAHGFTALSENAQMLYMTSAEHAPENDLGIMWDSFDFAWPEGAGTGPEALSQRDRSHPSLAAFSSPFVFETCDLGASDG